MDVAAIPKAELHLHADGLLGPDLLRRLHAAGEMTDLAEERLAALLPVRSPSDWLGRYGPGVAPYLHGEGVLRCLLAHVDVLAEQNVDYAEFMVSGLLDIHAEDREPMVDTFEKIREEAGRVAAGRLEVELLVAVGRGPLERLEVQTERILLLHRLGLVCGVALAGVEAAASCRDLAGPLARMREAGLGLEIHAGEQCGPESVRDALEHGRPHRLGHALAAFEDPLLVEEILRRDLHVELCPTSNMKVAGVRDIRHHPVARARDAGVSFSVNTDDPGPFECTLTSELDLLRSELRFAESDFRKIHDDALRARFAGR